MRRIAFVTIILGTLMAFPVLHAQHNAAREAIEEKIRLTPEEIRQMLANGSGHGADPAYRATLSEESVDETVVSSDPAPESELHAVINPVNSSNLIVSVIHQGNNQIDPTGWLVCPIFYSNDLGKTWSRSSFRTTPPSGAFPLLGGGDPMLAFDAEGTAYISWINLFSTGSSSNFIFGLYWASSTDGGATWNVSDKPAIGEGNVSFAGGEVFDKQWMVIDTTTSKYRNTIYVAFMHSDGNFTTIGVRRKEPLSSSFTTTDAVVAENFAEVQFASIDVGLAGDVHVSFYGNGDDGPALYHSVSTDGGKTFSEPNIISIFHMPRISQDEPGVTITGIDASRIYPCPHLVVDHSDGPTRGNIYQIWSGDGTADDRGNGLDVYFSRSTDNGLTWSTPVIVNDDPRGLVRHQFYPSLTVNPHGYITIGWYDRRADAAQKKTDYYVTHSLDGGLSFQPSFKITSKATDFSTVGSRNGGFGIGEYTQIVSAGDYVFPFWADGRKGTGDLDVYMAMIPAGKSEVGRVSQVADASADLRIHDPIVGSDRIELDVELGAASELSATLVDLSGRTVARTGSGRVEAGIHALRIPIAGLPSGAYLLRCDTDFGNRSRTVAVVR